MTTIDNPFKEQPKQYLYVFIVLNQGRKHTVKIKAVDYNNAVDEVERKFPDFDNINIIGKPTELS